MQLHLAEICLMQSVAGRLAKLHQSERRSPQYNQN